MGDYGLRDLCTRFGGVCCVLGLGWLGFVVGFEFCGLTLGFRS